MSIHLAKVRPPQPVKPGEPIAQRYARVRLDTEELAARLSPEDQGVQSMPAASPAKWHRAHTTWFFEAFILKRQANYREFDANFGYLYNSYYEAIGPRQARDRRGVLSRPIANDITDYRAHVDDAMQKALSESGDADFIRLVELGLNHEQQHQELLLTDILHAFAQNPIRPVYLQRGTIAEGFSSPAQFIPFDGGLTEIGHAGSGFAFDNEGPRHTVFLHPFALSNRLVTNADWLEFIDAGGYRNPRYWLADGWAKVTEENWSAPLYWERREGDWFEMTLAGIKPLTLSAPVAHIGFYEADAYARFKEARLPTEAEWEFAAGHAPVEGHFRDEEYLYPLPARFSGDELLQMFGDVWEWTASAYSPYPGFRADAGAIGEYNGKFMINQVVLRGGSCTTPAGHIRATYRNFFYPHQRWQFSGLRLAKDLSKSERPYRDAEINPSEFLRDVWSGLAKSPKRVPSKYLYDGLGAKLFEQICELPEYYLTRSELVLLEELAPELAEIVRQETALVEFGCGAGIKPRILFDTSRNIDAYVPIDICGHALSVTATELARDYPDLEITPITADFTTLTELPAELRWRPLLGFFPGSTIGNFEEKDAIEFLSRARRLLSEGRLLIGIDLVKDIDTLELAYDDPPGITAAFNRNLLLRINKELDADFELDGFAHHARWNAEKSRMEMHLVSLRDQEAHVSGRRFSFPKGDAIHTENSHKYQLSQFSRLASRARWQIEKIWMSHNPRFAVLLLR